MVLVALSTSGCASYMVASSSKAELKELKQETAIKAVQLGEGGAGIGIDVSNLEVLKAHPWKQAGAALLDAAILYGAYEGVNALDSKDSTQNDNTANMTYNGDSTEINITITGDGNETNIGNDNSTTSP